MLSKENRFFEEMGRVGVEYSKKKEALRARKRQIVDAYGWDSEEMKAWNVEDEATKYPYTQGEFKAYRAWEDSASRGDDEVEMNDFLWEGEVEDFVGAFRKAGIQSFVYTNRSTAVMENLHWFASVGCEMQGLCVIERHERRFGEENVRKILGIRFTLD